MHSKPSGQPWSICDVSDNTLCTSKLHKCNSHLSGKRNVKLVDSRLDCSRLDEDCRSHALQTSPHRSLTWSHSSPHNTVINLITQLRILSHSPAVCRKRRVKPMAPPLARFSAKLCVKYAGAKDMCCVSPSKKTTHRLVLKNFKAWAFGVRDRPHYRGCTAFNSKQSLADITSTQSSTTKLRTSKPSVLRDFLLWSLAKNFRHLPEMYK